MIEEKLPMICSKVLEIEILVREIETSNGLYISYIAKIMIGHDGSVYVREFYDDLRSIKREREIRSETFHNWAEFKAMDTVDFHPAMMIEEWAMNEHISLAWLGVN
jgi:hypothetical protein